MYYLCWLLFSLIQICISRHFLPILLKKLFFFVFRCSVFSVCSVLNSISSLYTFYNICVIIFEKQVPSAGVQLVWERPPGHFLKTDKSDLVLEKKMSRLCSPMDLISHLRCYFKQFSIFPCWVSLSCIVDVMFIEVPSFRETFPALKNSWFHS